MTPTDPDPYIRVGTPFTAHADVGLPDPTRAAIVAYRAFVADPIFTPAPTPIQVRLIGEYCQEYIYAPLPIYLGEEVMELRRTVALIRTVQELADWLWDCRRIGIEPL